MVGREAIIQKTTSSLLLESSRTVTHWEGIQCAGYVYFLWSGPHGLIIIHHLLDVSPGTCYLTSSSFGLLHWKRKLAVDQPYYTNEGLKLSLASVHGVWVTMSLGKLFPPCVLAFQNREMIVRLTSLPHWVVVSITKQETHIFRVEKKKAAQILTSSPSHRSLSDILKFLSGSQCTKSLEFSQSQA